MKREIAATEASIMTRAVLRAGILTEQQLLEMRQWAPPNLDIDPKEGDAADQPEDLEAAAARIHDALQSEGFVLVRETDLESVRQYLETSAHGLLHVEDVDIPVTFGRTPVGEYVIPWRSEGIQELMVSDTTYLVDGDARIYFKDVRELFFGANKAFMVCTVHRVER